MADDGTQLPGMGLPTPEELAQKRALAVKLIGQGLGPIQGESGTVAVSPFQVAGGLLQEGVGLHKLNQAAQQERELRGTGVGAESDITPPGLPSQGQGGPLSMMPPGAPLPGGVGNINSLLNATARQEGPGSYHQIGPIVRTSYGLDKAYGKYQVMGANIPQWTKQILGYSMTPEQFLQDPTAQETVARAKLSEYAQKYGPEGAAKAWFAGEKGMNNPNATAHKPDGTPLGPTVSQYGANAAALMGGGSPQAQPGGTPQPQSQNAPAGVRVASAGGALPTGALPAASEAQPAPAGPQAANVPGIPMGMLAQNAPAAPAGGNEAVAAARGPSPSPIPANPGLGAPGQAPVGPGGAMPSGFFAQRPQISKEQYQKILTSPFISPEQKAMYTQLYLGQGQPTTFNNAFGTVVRSPDGQQQFIGNIVDMSIKSPNGDVPIRGQYNADGTIRILQPQMGGPQGGPPQGGGPIAVPPPGPSGAAPSPGGAPAPTPASGSSGAVQSAMPKFASLETGTVNDAGPLGTTAPGIPANAVPQAGPGASGAEPSSAGGVKTAQGMIPQYATDTLDQLGSIAARQKFKQEDIPVYNKEYADFRDKSLAATAALPQIQYAQNLINKPGFIQGPLSDFKVAWNKGLTLLGDKDAEEKLSYNQIFTKVISNGILRDMKTMLGGWAGQVRNAEISLMNKASASQYNTLEANRAVLDIAARSQQQLAGIGTLIRQYRDDTMRSGGTPNSAGQDAIIRNYLDEHPLFTPEEIKNYSTILENDGKAGAVQQSGPLSAPPPGNGPPAGYKKVQ